METLVQFAAPVYAVEETEELVNIDLLRLGNLSRVTTVRYHTLDGSAKKGMKYQQTEGKITFEEGQYIKTFSIVVVQDETWSPTLEFKVALIDPEGGIVSPDGDVTRIKIIDDDFFPSNKYKIALEKGCDEIDKISQWGLFVEYVKLNLSTKGMFFLTAVTIIFDQMNNLYLFFLLKARTYLVNVVFNQDDPKTEGSLLIFDRTGNDLEDRIAAARTVALMYMLPMAALHAWDYTKTKMDIEGRSRVFLQTCMFRKYLNYNEASRQKVRVSHMQLAIMNNTADVAKAYSSLLDMLQMVGKLGLLMVFMLSQDPDSAYVLVLMPSLMMLAGCSKGTKLSATAGLAGPLKKVLIDLTTETCAKYRLIADYMQRPQMNEMFEKRATELRLSQIPEEQVEVFYNYVPKWLGPIFICGYIALTAEPVLTGEVSLGVFLASLSVFGEVSSDFSKMYEHVMAIYKRLDALRTLTKYFNLQTEVRQIKALNEHRREATRTVLEAAASRPPPPRESGLLRSDLICIQLDNVSFGYPANPFQPCRHMFKNINLKVPQGKMVAVIGCHGSGKGTFLRLLAQTIYPTEGFVLIPMHLRVLFVSHVPVLFDRPAWYNLVFGRPNFDNYGMLMGLLKEFDMTTTMRLIEQDRSDGGKKGQRHSLVTPLRQYEQLKEEREDCEIGENIEDEEHQGLLRACCEGNGEVEAIDLNNDNSWQGVLSYTEQVKLCLLRALLTNPEVLVLHRPLHNYDAPTQEAVLALLKNHTINRGLGLPESEWHHRRPRTLFFTPESVEQAAVADVIWHIDPTNSSVSVVAVQDLQKDFRATKHGEWTRNLRSAWGSQPTH